MMEISNGEAFKPLLDTLAGQEFLHDHAIWGHGTPVRETAEKIIAEGIVVNPSYSLMEIAIPLTGSDNTPEQNAKAILDQCLNWPHKDAKNVVLIAIPNGFRREQLIEEFIREQQARTRLPNRFIPGFVDVRKSEFIVNDAFELKPEPTPQESVKIGPGRTAERPVPIPTAVKNDTIDSVF